MLRPIFLWGGTGQARVLAEFLPAAGFEVIAVFDNHPDVESPWPQVHFGHGEKGFQSWWQSPAAVRDFAVAVGGDRGEDRLRLQSWLKQAGGRPVTLIHPAAHVAASAVVGEGSQILVRAVVGAESRLGEAVIINTGATVDHECHLADGVHLAPGVTLCGLVEIGRSTLIGAGAVVLPRVRVGAHTVVGAGSVVTRDLPDNVIAYGQPARIIRAHASSPA